MSARKALAVHEGGHAALAALYGLTVSLVTIAPTTIASAVTGAALDTAGHASCGGELADITAEAEAEKHIKVAFAGTMAERHLLPDSEPGLWRADWAIAAELVHRFWPAGTNARLVFLATEAAQDVQDMRRDIERVAEALLKRTTLTGAELRGDSRHSIEKRKRRGCGGPPPIFADAAGIAGHTTDWDHDAAYPHDSRRFLWFDPQAPARQRSTARGDLV